MSANINDRDQAGAKPGAWDRPAVSFRLSSRRRADLLALIGSESLSPTQALDCAIERATREGRQEANRLSGPSSLSNEGQELASAQALEALSLRMMSEAASSRETLSGLLEMTRALRDTIRAAAESPDLESLDELDPDSDAAQAIPLRLWLNQEALCLPRAAFLIKTLWLGGRRMEKGRARHELRAQRCAAAELQGDAGRGAPARVSWDISGESGPSLHALHELYWICQRDTAGSWSVTPGKQDAQGKVRPAGAALRL